MSNKNQRGEASNIRNFSNGQQSSLSEAGKGRWALGIADVGVQGAKAERGIESDPNTFATSAVLQTDADREQAATIMNNQAPIGGSAATLLMAASSLAHTPAQSVSNALLGQVQMVAAEEQIRRNSLPRPSWQADGSQMERNDILERQSSTTASSRPATLPVAEQNLLQNSLSQFAFSSSMNTGTLGIPLSPRSSANFQVGSIATKTAVNEYVEQVSYLSDPASQSIPAPHSHRFPLFPQHTSLSSQSKRWDANNPFQGVPSLPLTPSASLAMIPPPNLTLGMTTPLTPEGLQRNYYFQPTYRLAAEEYEILASAAAVATVAFTTATSGSTSTAPQLVTNTNRTLEGGIKRTSRPLNLQEQEEIASTLRAWAGLEGAERQREARRKLQERQTQLSEPSNDEQTQFFPPDFARHYKSQLTALAAGYYQKLHFDGLTESQWAPSVNDQVDELTPIQKQQDLLHDRQQNKAAGYPQSSGSLTTANLVIDMGTSTDEFQNLQRNAMQSKNQAQQAITVAQQIRNDDSNLRSKNKDQDSIEKQQQDIRCQAESTPSDKDEAVQVIDPMKLIANASNAAGLDVSSPQVRDHLLQYAHTLYSNGITTVTDEDKKEGKATTKMHPTLLPLLHTLHNLHSQHLPTLLLLSCAYYSSGDLAASLWYNKLILRIDSNYVESMSNIGTTLRALGRWNEAESWWWRAIKLRPGYWDAYENLLGVLCSPQQIPLQGDQSSRALVDKTQQVEITGPRFLEALKLCEFVENHVMNGKKDEEEKRARKVPGGGGGGDRPICLPLHLPLSQIPRLQNLFYAKGNLKYVVPDMGSILAAKEYQKAIELLVSTSEQSAYSLRDLVMATIVIGVLTMGVELPEAKGRNAAADIAQALGLDKNNVQQAQAAASAQYTSLSSGGVLKLVRDAGDSLVHLLLRLGGGRQLPMLLMLPDSTLKLSAILFAESGGFLPSIVSSAHAQKANLNDVGVQQALQQASTMTSTILLTLSKLFQDGTGNVKTGPHGSLTLGGIPASTSLLLPLYYLSISLNPSASTANNLGILLSSIPAIASVMNNMGQRQQMNGQTLALQYYTYGLQLDSKHPHLYTNLGSLLKDLNHLNDAIQMYEKAIECNPSFDVALANLGNAIKDQGRTQDSVQYYRRAVRVNPNFPEALCGLVNALLAICDWKEVYGDDDEGTSGFMKKVQDLLDKQLEDGSLYGARALSVTGTVQDWVNMVIKSTGDNRAYFRQYLEDKFEYFYSDQLDRKAEKINEGSFVIRLIERMMKRSQRRWYLDAFVNGKETGRIIVQDGDIQRYSRMPLPPCLVTPTVPTVLPFHTFTLKIPPRHIRLISHRNALRISQTTLTQPWLPLHVYPPPPPPKPKYKIGYISSDFNNHPLAHLMQSVFGFHNLDEFEVFLYATTVSDQSPYRQKIEKEAQHFTDVNTWSNEDVIKQILKDEIHILINLNGYTKGARNEIFAARPCPVQMEFMGFAGGLASVWTDWIIVDPIVCPPEMTSSDVWRNSSFSLEKARPTDWKGDLDPEGPSNDWVYAEKCIYMPDSYFVNDHRQGFREPKERQGMDGKGMVRPYEMSEEESWAEEEERRWKARKEMWPSLPDDFVILSDFNQLYKLEPTLFKLWLRILQRVPNSILWLLRFPAAGEAHLLEYANTLFGPQVASRIIFTEVAPKGVHIHRGRIADLFLDTLECGAHTTSADILWSATPVLTWPKHKHKMASRVAASIVNATGLGHEMIVDSEKAYEDRAVELAKSLTYTYVNSRGEKLKAVSSSIDTIQADSLEINKDSSSAMLHGQPANGHSNSSNSSSSSSSSGNGTYTFASNQTIQGTTADPAPANVKQAAAVAQASLSSQTKAASFSADRQQITLPSHGEQAPAETASRRSHGPLADLRRKLFLTRDTNRLFDTKRWVVNLEKGYKEAWSRFVDGTDTEESLEWHNLPNDDPRKKSGHIWIPK